MPTDLDLAASSAAHLDLTSRPPVDFRVATGPAAIVGTLDAATKSVAEDGYTAHLPALLALIGKAGQADELANLPRPVVRMIGSSTQQDLDGDIMYPSAIQDMTRADANLSIALNHSYNLPEDLFGSMIGTPWTQSKDGITDLYLQSDVEVLNPRAAQVFMMVARDRRIGVSGGFMVLDCEWIDRETGKPVKEEDLSFEDVIFGAVTLGIKSVKAVEWSTVMIPSNQRSWVESAVKGLFARTGKALLAPIVRQLYPNHYKSILGEIAVTSNDARAALEDIAPRKSAQASTGRIYWNPAEQAFVLDTRTGGASQTKSLSRQELTQLLGTSPLPGAHTATTRATSAPETAPMPTQKHANGHSHDAPTKAETKAASDEDKAAQEARSKKYHIGVKEGGNVTKPSAYADVPDSQWADPVNYRYHMEDKAHADNAAARWGDASNRSQYSQDEQDIISKRIEKRQRDFGEEPSGDGGKSAGDAILAKRGSDGDPAVGDVEVASDGTHAPYTGTHTHKHAAFGSQGDDGMHEHEHAHKGDANHNHSHAQKAAAPSVSKASDGVAIDGDGGHAPMTGKHTHAHKAYGMPDADGKGMHEHTHEHTDDASHGHDHYGADGHDAPKGETPDATKADDGVPPREGGSASAPPRETGQNSGPVGPCPNCQKAVPDGHDGSYRCDYCKHCLSCGIGPIDDAAITCPNCAASMVPHSGEKGVQTPDKESAPSIAVDADGNHAPYTGAHAHPHKAYGAEADGSMHSHEHNHSADSNHHHVHVTTEGSGSGSSDGAGGKAAPDPAKVAILAAYNALGKQLGLAEVTLSSAGLTQKCSLVDNDNDAQRVITLVSELDRVTDTLYGAPDALNQTFAISHELMQLLGVPDPDGGAGTDTGNATIADANLIFATDTTPGVRKAGARHSSRDTSDLQAIHDAVMRLTDGTCCGGASMQEQGDNTPAEGGKGTSEGTVRQELESQDQDMGANTHNQRATTPDVLKALDATVAALSGISTKALSAEVESIASTIAKAREDLSAHEQRIATLKAEHAALKSEQDALTEQVRDLANLPLPRPTSLHRTIDLTDPVVRAGVATYQDMREAAHEAMLRDAYTNGVASDPTATPAGTAGLTLDAALKQTTLKVIDGLIYRHWPAGLVPQGGRPVLSNTVKTVTSLSTMMAYANGEECLVRVESTDALPAVTITEQQ